VHHGEAAQRPEQQRVAVADLPRPLQNGLRAVILGEIDISQPGKQQRAELARAGPQGFLEFGGGIAGLVLEVAGDAEVYPRCEDVRVRGEDLPVQPFRAGVVVISRGCLRLRE
jgi:hypothetical protein